MTKTVTVGKRLIPVEHIALIEPFDPTQPSRIETDRDLHSRIVLVNRESVLSEVTPSAFAEAHGFRMLPDEDVATNPGVRFGVETFEPAEGFNPTKPYKSRLTWRDLEGDTQSKLLLTEPAKVLAIAVRGEEPSDAGTTSELPPKPRRAVRRRRRTEPDASVPF